MLTERSTLAQYLIEERRQHPTASGELNGLILDVAVACKAIAARVALGALGGALGSLDGTDDGEGGTQRRLGLLANDDFVRATAWGGYLAGMASEELADLHPIPPQIPRGKYLLAFDSLDGSSDIDVNVPVGSIFSILRAPRTGDGATEDGAARDGATRDATVDDFLRPGTEQVCAGYAIYGPSTLLVLTVGRGVHAFTLERQLGEFILTRPDIRLPAATNEFAVNASNRRFWEPAVKRYLDECLAGKSGPRGRDFTMRWVASLVAETHRILTRGGVFLYPRNTQNPGTLRLLFEANPVALLIEQAGGRASTGRGRILEVAPEGIDQRTELVFGVSEEVERIEHHHRENNDSDIDLPLYGARGLFRAATI